VPKVGDRSKMMRLCVAFLAWFALAGAAAAQSAPEPEHVDQPVAAADSPDYRLGAGDKIRISVFGEESLSGEFLVSGGAGTIAFPLIGDVEASGLTVAELQSEIEGKLKPDYLKNPQVSIEG
jgi:protein involved in polysaccharide export with SLBB domain